MTDDLVKRLRFGVAIDEQGDVSWCSQEVMFNAADRIEKLEAVLNSIADVTERWEHNLISQVNEMFRKALERKYGL